MDNQRNSMWLTRQQALDQLGISARTLTYWCSQGKVERRMVGRKGFYRPCSIQIDADAPTQNSNADATTHAKRSALAIAPVATVAPSPDASPDLATWSALVQQLTHELSQANQDKGEAVGIGWILAEQRERLANQLTEMQRALYDVAGSRLALPVRKRIMQILKRSLH